MTRLHVDHVDSKLPVLLVFGEKSFLTKQFIEESKENFRIVLISPSEHKGTIESELYQLTYEESSVLPQLEEDIEYALIYLENPRQKAYIAPILQKLTSDKTKTLLLVNAYRVVEFEGLLREVAENKHITTALSGDLLDKRDAVKETPLSELIKTITEKKELKFTGDDLLPIYTITPTDAVYCINRLLYGRFKNDTLYYLFYQHPETLLSAAHLISRIDPDIEIHFTENPHTSTSFPSRSDISRFAKDVQLNEAYIDNIPEGFEKGVENLLNQTHIISSPEAANEEQITKTTPIIEEKRTAPRIEKKHLSPIFTVTIMSFVLFFFANAALFLAGLFFLKSSVSALEKQNLSAAQQNSVIAQQLLTITKPTIYLLAEATTILDKSGKVVETYHLLEQATALSSLTSSTLSDLSNGKTVDSTNALQQLLGRASFILQEGERIKIEQNNEMLKQLIKPEYSKLLSLSQVLPEVLGFHSEKNYLLLFQNNGELRPTGGFIGSVGELKLNKGKVEELQIQDVYDLDGQLKNHVEPPFVVRRYLQPHLFLRDSNFSLNFQEAATTAAMLYNLETKKKPDGVIAIDFFVLQELMDVTGPIKLEAYNTTIDKNNIFDLIQTEIEEEKFAGSTKKKDILNSLFNQIMLKFEDDPNLWLKMGQKLPMLLEEKHIQVSFGSQSVQNIFNANNYAGESTDKRVIGSKDITDYLYINEANIGVNKVNMLIKREVEYEAVLTDSSYTSNAVLKLQNNSTTDDYTAYLQFVAPKNSRLTYIDIDGKRQKTTPAVVEPKAYEARNFKAPTDLEVEEAQRNNLTYFSFIIKAPKGKLSTIQVSYDNGASKGLAGKDKYSLLTIKQPGTEAYAFHATVFYPDNYSLSDSSANSYGKNYATFNVDLRTDNEFELRLRKK